MNVKYFPTSDMLAIHLANGPATGGGEDVADGITFSYDDEDKLVVIEIYDASQRVDLTDIRDNPILLADDSNPPAPLYTVRLLAEQWDIAPRTLQQTIETMRKAGVEVGQSQGNTTTIVLSEADVEALKRWREEHPRGRPAAPREPAQA